MLVVVESIDDNVTSRLFEVYAESMADLSSSFPDEREMRASYREFLEGFVSQPGQLVLVEEDAGTWKSGLRVVSCGDGCWFAEAVETDPDARRRGYGRLLLLHAAEHLRSLGAREMTCCIHESNVTSRLLHESCGFRATGEDPVNPWGELEEGCIVYQLVIDDGAILA